VLSKHLASVDLCQSLVLMWLFVQILKSLRFVLALMILNVIGVAGFVEYATENEKVPKTACEPSDELVSGESSR